MQETSKWRQLADDVALMSFPWRATGIDFRRTVTLIRLIDGRVIIHSTAPFTESDAVAIRQFGEPAWLVDATLLHDTFAKHGRAAFPNLPYLAPDGFTAATDIPTTPLAPAPPDWAGEVDVMPIDGVRSKENVLFHRRSRTLIVGDLFFSLPDQIRGWPRFFVRHFMRLPRLFGVSAFFRMLALRDAKAFRRSMGSLLDFDFERLVVAHYEPVERDAKGIVEQALRDVKLSP